MTHLSKVHRQVVVSYVGEDLPEVLLVLLDGAAAHMDIIYITEDIRNITKQFMYHPLKCAPTVLQTKGHLVPLPMSKRSNDSGLGDCRRAHGDLIVP